MRGILSLLWPVSALSAHALWAQENDPTEVLIRLRDQVIEHAGRVPHHTCIETVERQRFDPALGRQQKSCDTLMARRKAPNFQLKLLTTDRLRLDVTLSSTRELFSWAGASKFEDVEIDELIPTGAIGTGAFASLLMSVFETGTTRFIFEGDTAIKGRPLLEYSFTIPQDRSQYRARAGRDWVVTGYTGHLLVDPSSAQLVRLVINTEELPPSTNSCQTDTTLDYGMVQLGINSYLLPVGTRQRFIGIDGSEAENTITFASCREYKGESTVSFGEHTSGASGSPQAPPPAALPQGLPVVIDLGVTISSTTAAAGDRVEGRLVKPIVDADGRKFVPEGAHVTGRLLRVETQHVKPVETTIAIRWETIEIEGANRPISLLPDHHTDRSRFIPGVLRQRGMEIELPRPGEDRVGVYRFPGEFAIIDPGLRTTWLTAK